MEQALSVGCSDGSAFFCSNFGKRKNKFDKMYSLLYYFYEMKMKLPAESVIDRIIAPGMSSVRVKGVA
ncbi:MAG: hypothetical protein GYA36_05100 [Veillonellaceae bacterium]|nr:hypothetical protein [Veillonellaceae bacterium]